MKNQTIENRGTISSLRTNLSEIEKKLKMRQDSLSRIKIQKPLHVARIGMTLRVISSFNFKLIFGFKAVLAAMKVKDSSPVFAELKKLRTENAYWNYLVPFTEKEIGPLQQKISKLKGQLQSN